MRWDGLGMRTAKHCTARGFAAAPGCALHARIGHARTLLRGLCGDCQQGGAGAGRAGQSADLLWVDCCQCGQMAGPQLPPQWMMCKSGGYKPAGFVPMAPHSACASSRGAEQLSGCTTFRWRARHCRAVWPTCSSRSCGSPPRCRAWRGT
jgi:hypothetical protein